MWTIRLIDEDAQYKSRVVMLWEMGDDVVRDKENYSNLNCRLTLNQTRLPYPEWLHIIIQ